MDETTEMMTNPNYPQDEIPVPVVVNMAEQCSRTEIEDGRVYAVALGATDRMCQASSLRRAQDMASGIVDGVIVIKPAAHLTNANI